MSKARIAAAIAVAAVVGTSGAAIGIAANATGTGDPAAASEIGSVATAPATAAAPASIEAPASTEEAEVVETTDVEKTTESVESVDTTVPKAPTRKAAAPAVEPAAGDVTAPVIQAASFAPVKGVQTFSLSQFEANPQKTYVEVQQKDGSGIWRKKSGEWFFATNAFAFTVDTDALADGPDTQLKVSTWDVAGNTAGKTFPVIIDRVKPVATLVAPADGGPVDSSSVDIALAATDDHGLNRVTANLYRDGALFKSTSSAADGALAATHVTTVNLPDGEYVIRYNASDLAGNIASTGQFPFEVDTVAPQILVKDGTTVVNGIYAGVPSFKLQDAGLGEVDYVVANGTKHERTNNKWSDLNAGNYTAVQGLNTVTVFDTAGNSSTFTFVLDTVAPQITVKDGASVVNGVFTSVPSFKLQDAGIGQIDYVVANGKKYERTNSKYSDLNAGNYTAVQGLNTITVFDTAGNSTTFTFVLDTVAPSVVGIAQEYQAKEGGRTAVTLTFSEPIDGASLGQGWYGNGTSFSKVYYREKAITVSFSDLVGHVGTYAFTAQEPVAP